MPPAVLMVIVAGTHAPLLEIYLPPAVVVLTTLVYVVGLAVGVAVGDNDKVGTGTVDTVGVGVTVGAAVGVGATGEKNSSASVWTMVDRVIGAGEDEGVVAEPAVADGEDIVVGGAISGANTIFRNSPTLPDKSSSKDIRVGDESAEGAVVGETVGDAVVVGVTVGVGVDTTQVFAGVGVVLSVIFVIE